MTAPNAAPERAWALIENEKRRDRFVRRVSIAAWSVTLALVLLVAILVGMQVLEVTRVSGLPRLTAIGLAMPFIDILWKLSLLVASLSTVGVFLRLRTATLTEIQLRLAALEELLASRPDARQG